MKAVPILPVLVVDDEEEILKSIARDLRRTAPVTTFTDPTEALKSFEDLEYAAVISDLKMPEMNGLEFLKECARIRPAAQRILLTAYVDLASLPESINIAKLNLLLTKPWESDELRIAVESALRNNEILRENAELRKIALTDGLTGISNHRYFWERLESEFSRAQRYGRPLSLIMCDIDDFKKFNDEFGHQKGDSVLREVAQCLDRNKRSMDTVARYGGEEFAVILPEVTRPQGIEIAKRYLATTESSTGVGISLGVAAYPDDAKSSTELVQAADFAMLRAKKNGKRQVVSALDLKK